MKTPYEILCVDENATDERIKEAYLQHVQQCPPDRDPARFEEIRRAFDTIRDAESRMSHALFSRPPADFDDLLDRAFDGGPLKPLSAADFEALLRASATDRAPWNTIPLPGKP